MRSTLLLAVLLCSIAFSVFAQKETGSILGTVTDSEGGPIPGATVTASSSSLIGGSAVTQTDEKGHYRFPVLAPGIYSVQAELSGYQTIIRSGLRLYVGNTLTVDMTISQTKSEEVTVQGTTPLVDVTTPAASKTVPVETVENLPKAAFALDLFTLTPGVGDISYVAYGAGGSQANGYWFDGVDISNPVDGSYWVYPNYNWIEEVQVVGLGAPAEYGGFTGVISNSVSRSGSNDFHGLFETFYEKQSFISNNVSDPELQPNRVDLFTDNTVQLGGRLIRDKLWFFAGGQWYYQRYAPFGYPPGGGTAFAKDDQPRVIGKLTYKADTNNTLQGFLEWDNYTRTGQGADAFTLPEATGIAKAPEWFYNSTWTSLVKSSTVLDVKFSGYAADYNIEPQNGDTPQHGDYSGILSANYWRVYLTNRTRNQLNASVSHYADNFIKGHHDFKFGIEYERSNANRSQRYTGGVYYYDYYGAPYYRYLWQGYSAQGRIRRVSTFVQDEWALTKKVNLSIGVRYDHNHVFLADAPEFQYTTNPVAPRLGMTYDIMGNQKTVFKIHYGHYYQKPMTFYVDGINNFGDKTTQYWDGTQWVDTSFTPGTGFWTIDPKLKQPYRQQFMVGIEQQLPYDIPLSVHYIYAKDKDQIEDVNQFGIFEPIPFVNPLTGETITIYNQLNYPQPLLITNVNQLYRRYNGLEITAAKRFSSKFTMNGSLVFSRTKSNISNTDDTSDGFSDLLNDPNFAININGKPTYDPTVEVKLTGIFELPYHVETSFYYRHATGDTWTPLVRLSGLNQGTERILGLPRGSERLDSRNIVDLRMEKGFPISKGELLFTADLFNLFNTGYVYDVEDRYDRSTFGEPTSYTDPRVFRLGIRYKF